MARATRCGVVAVALSAILAPLSQVSQASASSPSDRASVVARGPKLVDRAAARRHARERRALTRALRRNPRRALRGSFLRRAAVVGLKLPVTVRLREGTKLGVTWAPTRSPLEGSLFPAPSGTQTLQLAGRFPMVIDFDAGAGYGGPGNIQARSGPGGAITADGPLVMSELAGCAATPPAFVEAATSTSAGAPILASAATQTWVDMNPFTGASDGYLDLKLSVRSRVLGAAARCGTPGTSADYDVPVTASATDPWNMPFRIRWDGTFRIAPAIAADGAIRFGKITADGAIQPQGATTGNLWGCAADGATTGAGLPLVAPCTAVGASLGEPVSPVPFPAAVVVESLSADILLGDRT